MVVLIYTHRGAFPEFATTTENTIMAKKKTETPSAPSAPLTLAPAPTVDTKTPSASTYSRTAADNAKVSMFIDSAKRYDRQTHEFANACAAMYKHDLHNNEGVKNFGDWCSVQFKAAGITNIDGGRAYQLAKIGEFLADNSNAPELLALSSNALLAMSRRAADITKATGLTPVEAAKALPEFMAAQKIGNSLSAVNAMADHGMAGDNRDAETKAADALTEWTYGIAAQIVARGKTEDERCALIAAIEKEVETQARASALAKKTRNNSKRN